MGAKKSLPANRVSPEHARLPVAKNQVAPITPVSDSVHFEDLIIRNVETITITRTVRIFLSSTFRDFAFERDYLMRHALPELQNFGAERGIMFIFVDLRWGVTSEESSGGDVLKLCLQEIDACRPFFVGMLGERYGWHISGLGDESLLETTMNIGERLYPWIANYRDRSVTELEMLYGALLQPGNSEENATFYFRDHQGFKRIMQNKIEKEELSNYEPENDHAYMMQSNLKAHIRKSFPQNICEYADIKDLSDSLVQHISVAVERMFPHSKTEDSWDLIQVQHRTFAASRTIGYIRNETMDAKIASFLRVEAVNQMRGLAVYGVSGAGKTACLANWHFDSDTYCVFSHFVGSTPESTDYFHILRRMAVFFTKRFGYQVLGSVIKTQSDVASTDALKLVPNRVIQEIIPELLASVVALSSKSQIVLVLDGADQLDEKGQSLHWLPDVPGVHLLISMKTDTTPWTHWRNRKWFETYEIQKLGHDSQQEMVRKYLAVHAKKFDSVQMSLIEEYKAQCSNPLFLHTVLDEARLFGNFFDLTDYLRSLLQAASAEELFYLVLSRMGRECGKLLVHWVTGLILYSKDGLTDQEIREILTVKNHDNFTLQGDEHILSLVQLLYSVREQLCLVPGILQFFHESIKTAVGKYINGASHVFHLRLADYFTTMATDDRKLRELPYHLLKTNRIQELANFLAQPDVIVVLLNDESRKYEYLKFWNEIGTQMSLDGLLLEAFNKCKSEIGFNKLDRKRKQEIESGAQYVGCIGVLLELLGYHEAACNVIRDSIVLNTFVYGEVHSSVGEACLKLAAIYEKVFCNFDVSLKLKQRAIDIDRELNGDDHLDLDSLIAVYIKMCRWKDALNLCEKSLNQKRGPLEDAHTYTRLGEIYEYTDNSKMSGEMYNKALSIRQKLLGPSHPAVARSLMDLGSITALPENVEQGYVVLRNALGACHPDVAAAANNLACVYSKNGDYSKALELHQTANKVIEERVGDDHPIYATSLCNIANVCQEIAEQAFISRDDQLENEMTSKAEEHYTKAILIYKVKLGDASIELATTTYNYASFLYDIFNRDHEKNTLQSACNHFKQAYEMRLNIFGAESETAVSSRDAWEQCETMNSNFNKENGFQDPLVAASTNAAVLEAMIPNFPNPLSHPGHEFDAVLTSVADSLQIDLPSEHEVRSSLSKLGIDSSLINLGQFVAMYQDILMSHYVIINSKLV